MTQHAAAPGNFDPDVYFLADEKDFATRVLARFDEGQKLLKTTNRHTRMLRVWRAYLARSSDGSWDTTEIKSGGRKGEHKLLKPNEFRNLILHMLQLATSAPPAYEPMAINNDAESMQATMLARGLIDYYVEEKGLAEKRKRRAETALWAGESMQLTLWDPNIGDEVAVDDADPERPARDGDFAFYTLDPYNFVYDQSCADPNNPPWLICRVAKNKWDLMASFPDHADVIKDLDGWSAKAGDLEFDYSTVASEEDDMVAAYYVFAADSPALPGGKQGMIIKGGDDGAVALFKGKNEYGKPGSTYVPAVRCAPEEVPKVGGGYTPAFDLLTLHEMNGAVWSTILSAINNLGTPMIGTPKGSGFSLQDMGSYKHIEYMSGKEPTVLNMHVDLSNLFGTLPMIQSAMERIGVINSAVRGDTDAMKGDSGKKAALVQAAASQFSQGFQQQLRLGDAKQATHMIATLITHSKTKTLTAISGKRSAAASRSFMGEQLAPINRVMVPPANPYRDTQEGRRELLGWHMDRELIKSGDDILEVLTTGRLEPLYEDEMTAALSMRKENEILADPSDSTPLIISPYENHPVHIKQAASVLDSPEAKSNEAIRAEVERHIQGHMEMWRSLPPDVLAVIGLKPPPPPPPPGMTAGDMAMMGAPANDNGPPRNDGAPPQQGGPPKPANDNGGPPTESAGDLPTPPDNPLTGEANAPRPLGQ